jgi:hypothetical protein
MSEDYWPYVFVFVLGNVLEREREKEKENFLAFWVGFVTLCASICDGEDRTAGRWGECESVGPIWVMTLDMIFGYFG